MAENISDQTQRVLSLAQSFSRTDPKLYQILVALADQMGEITRVVDPIVSVISTRLIVTQPPSPPENVEYRIIEQAIRISWDRPSDGTADQFEIRNGLDWETAEFVTRTSSTVVEIRPLVGQALVFLLRSLNVSGVYSTEVVPVIVIVTPPTVVSVSGQVVDNNVLLRWNVSSSDLGIDYYEVKKGTQVVGTIKGTFALLQELIAGEYTYSVTPVDIVGNRGDASSITLRVNQPPDYVLTDTFISNFSGPRSQVRISFDPLLLQL